MIDERLKQRVIGEKKAERAARGILEYKGIPFDIKRVDGTDVYFITQLDKNVVYWTCPLFTPKTEKYNRVQFFAIPCVGGSNKRHDWYKLLGTKTKGAVEKALDAMVTFADFDQLAKWWDKRKTYVPKDGKYYGPAKLVMEAYAKAQELSKAVEESGKKAVAD